MSIINKKRVLSISKINNLKSKKNSHTILRKGCGILKDIGLKMGAVPSIDVLNYLSDINKRKDYSLKLKKFLNNELSGDDLKIDWSKDGTKFI